MTLRFATRQTLRHTTLAALTACACLGVVGVSQAQSLDSLKGMVGGGSSSEGGAAGGVASALGLGSSGSSSLGNATGIMSYCIKNNYLGGGDASSMKDKLMGKLTGGSETKAAENTDYTSGLKGILNTGEGKSVDLSSLGGGMKEKITKQVCDKVLSQAKSFL